MSVAKIVIISPHQNPSRVHAVANELDMKNRWEGDSANEKGYADDGCCIIAVDECYFSPAEVETLLCDPSKTKIKLGGVLKTSFKELVVEMVREDMRAAKRDELIKKSGLETMDYHE